MFHSSQNENTFHSLLFAEYSHARNLPDVNVHVNVNVNLPEKTVRGCPSYPYDTPSFSREIMELAPSTAGSVPPLRAR
jgi:hypothetical protein